MVESLPYNSQKQKIIEASANCLLTSVKGIGIIFFAWQLDGFNFGLRFFVGIKITNYEIRFYAQIFCVIQTSITTNIKIVGTEVGFYPRIIRNFNSTNNNASDHFTIIFLQYRILVFQIFPSLNKGL